MAGAQASPNSRPGNIRRNHAFLSRLLPSVETCRSGRGRRAHVKEVVAFLKDEYSKAGLKTLAQEEKFEVLSQEDVNLIINSVVGKTEG